MMGLGDYENTFAWADENGIVTSMDVENGVVYGSCLHGKSIQALGPAVLFVESCNFCPRVLESEGFLVQIPGGGITLAA